MKVIWKAEIQLDDLNNVLVKEGSRFLFVQKQGDSWCVWFECDPTRPNVTRPLHCVGTGHHRISPNWLYVNSVIDGSFVWHFYQENS